MQKIKRIMTFIISVMLVLSMVTSEILSSNAAVLNSGDSEKESANISGASTDLLTQKDLQKLGYLVPGMDEAKEIKSKEIKKARYIDQGIQNEYIEVNVNDDGRYTIGTVEGNPNYTSDNNQKLLYGHPGGATSDTLIKIDDNEIFFRAETIDIDEANGRIYAYMTISEYGVQIIETLEFVKSDDGINNTVKINYKAINTGSTVHEVGIRIMIDTMLASNDHAPFKVSGYGNVTTRREFSGSAIPKTYQVYDDLDSPTTIATGIVYATGEKKPDRVQFTNWGNVSGASWNYNHGEGDRLGDSAVVFYYNPVSLSHGASRSVSTYYGTSIGTALRGDSEIIIGSNQIGVRIKDRSTGEGLSKATVKVTNISTGRSEEAQTDDIGLAIFNNVSDLKGNCRIQVTKSNYQTTEIEKTLQAKQLVSIFVKEDADHAPSITSAKLGDLNVMPGYSKATYCENKDEVKATASNSKIVQLKVTSDQTGCIYRLIQNGSVVENSTNGIFNLTVIMKDAKGKNYSVSRIDGFSAGSEIYVQAIGADGAKSRKKKLGIQIKEPSSGKLDSTKTSVSIGSKVSIKLNGDKMNPVEKFFLGDSEISLGSDAFPAYVEVEETGKVKIGINKPEKKSFTEYKNDFMKNMKNTQTRKQALQSFGGKKIRVGGVEPLEWYIAGYGEGIVKDGVATIEVDVYAYLKKGASWTTYWFVLSCPVYVKTGIEGKLQGEIALKANYDNGWMFQFTKGDINPSVKGSVEVGAGVSGVLSIGIEGSGDIAYLYSLPNNYYKLSTTLECGIKAKAFLLEYNKTWASYTKVWKDGYTDGKLSNAKASQSKDESFDEAVLYDFDRYQQIPRTYLKLNENPSKIKKALLNIDTDATTIKTNTFTNAQPQYVEVNGHQYCFFLEDANGVEGIGNRTASDRTVLVYCEFDSDSNAWTAPKAILDDGTADFNFDVVSQGTQIYIVWQNINKKFGDSEASVEDYYSMSDISAAVLDIYSGKVSEYKVASTDHADLLPKVAAKGSNVTIAWYESKNNEITSTDALNYVIHGAQLTGNVFEENVNKVLETGLINGLDVGYVNNQTVISYILDADQNAVDAEDTELYYILNNRIIRMTNNTGVDSHPMFIREGDSDVLYWYQDGSFVYSKDLETSELIVEKEGTSFTDDFAVLVNSDGSRKKIIWSRFSENYNEDLKNKSIYTIDYKNGSWSDPYELNGLGQGIVSSLSGCLDSTGKEHIVIQKVEYYENSSGNDEGTGEENISEVTSSNIYYLTSKDRIRVRVDDVNYDMNEAAPGALLPISIHVTNTGNKEISSLKFKLGEYEKSVDVNLAPGTSSEVKLTDYQVPTIEKAETHILEITEANNEGMNDVIYEADQNIYLGYTDLKVEEIGREIIEDQEYIVVNVENISKIDASNINLKVLADEEEGQVISDKFISELPAGEAKAIYIPLNKLEEIDIAYLRLTSDTAEINTLDNKGILALSDEVYEVSKEIDFSVISEDTAKGQVTYTKESDDTESQFMSGETVKLHAAPASGYVFTGWTEEIEDGTTGTFSNYNASDTTYILPNKDVKVIAHFAQANHAAGISDDTTEIHAYVDDRLKLTPTITTENGQGTTDYIKWVSSNENVANVENGKVVIVGAGNASITATLVKRTTEGEETTNQVVTYQIFAEKPQIQSIMLSSEPGTLRGAGDTINIKDELIVTPFKGAGTILWTTSDEKVATVNKDGKVTAVGKGTATITATVEGHEDITTSCKVNVVIPLSAVMLNDTEINLQKGNTHTLKATLLPEDYSDIEVEYSWKSLNENVATVTGNGSEATIHAVERGSTTIVVKVGDDISTYCNVNVEAHANSIRIRESEITLNKFSGYNLECITDPEIVEDTITWSSNNENVAIVDEWSGYVEAVNAGTATITVRTSNGKSASCRVTVNPYGDVYNISSNAAIVNVTDWSKLESDHDYIDNMSKLWVYKVDGAKSIKIHFDNKSATESGYDYIYVLDSSNRIIEKYTGGSGSILSPSDKTVTVEGDILKIYLVTDSSASDYGFKVDKAEITYNKQSISNASITVANQTYTGKPLTPEVRVVLNGKTLMKNVDYTVTYKNNINIGTASAIITGVTKYKDSVIKTFNIVQSEINKANQETANAVIDKINSMNVADAASVAAARAAYNQLTDAQKQLISAEIVNKLTDAEKAIANATPKKVSVKKIKLTGVSKKIAAGKKIKLSATVSPSNATNKKLKWKSSNKKVATVTQNGVVTIRKNTGGKTVVITATAADGSKKKASYKITVMKGVVKQVKISGAKTVKAGKSIKLRAKVTASKGANKSLKWISSNTKYAKVSSSGTVKALKKGKGKKVKITAMATDGSGKKASVVIKIK